MTVLQKCLYCGKNNARIKYCDRACACRARNTIEHQKKAGAIGGMVTGNKMRGTGTKGYVKENQRHQHRTVAERKIGRKLEKGEIVHHIDGDKHNNDPSNLQVMTQAEHIKIHLHTNYAKSTV